MDNKICHFYLMVKEHYRHVMAEAGRARARLPSPGRSPSRGIPPGYDRGKRREALIGPPRLDRNWFSKIARIAAMQQDGILQ